MYTLFSSKEVVNTLVRSRFFKAAAAQHIDEDRETELEQAIILKLEKLVLEMGGMSWSFELIVENQWAYRVTKPE